MQIVSGIYKNRKLKSPLGDKTHPMGSREKMALFNILYPYIENSVVLDAFAGSGALGLEAISRGANKVIFIENDKKAVNIIKDNLSLLGREAISKAMIVAKSIENYKDEPEKYDIIIADPPYDHFEISQIKTLLQFLKKDGILALSHPGEAPDLPNLTLQKSRKYAAATISFYTY